VVIGGARGADTLAVGWAKERTEWESLGRKTGPGGTSETGRVTSLR
jgi:hypothetical protein